jgi:Glyoxalase-like domain
MTRDPFTGGADAMPLRSRNQWWGVTLDAPDAVALGRFYARLLDWQFFPGDGGGGASVAPSENAGYNLGFQTEPDFVRPVWPPESGRQQMSMHLEIQVDDLDEAVAYAVEAGAVEAGYQPQATVRVMLDPAGHPFCLYVDDEPGSDQG